MPSGFGYDFAGVVDEVGGGATGFAVGDRVYGGALGRAAADFVVVKTPAEAPGAPEALFLTPDGISDEVASTLPVAGLTAAAALSAIDLRSGDTVLIGGAAGGVGVFAVQLAKLAGATVIGTASEGTFAFLRQLGAEPVAYGPGLADRVRTLAPGGVTAATDLFGTETAETALALGVPPERISTIAAGPNPPGGVRATGGIEAGPGRLGADHRCDHRRHDHRAHRRDLRDRADPRRRRRCRPAPRPRQDRGHAVKRLQSSIAAYADVQKSWKTGGGSGEVMAVWVIRTPTRSSAGSV